MQCWSESPSASSWHCSSSHSLRHSLSCSIPRFSLGNPPFLSFSFAGHKDGGCWSVLGPFSRASWSNLKLTSVTSKMFVSMCKIVLYLCRLWLRTSPWTPVLLESWDAQLSSCGIGLGCCTVKYSRKIKRKYGHFSFKPWALCHRIRGYVELK